MWKVFRLRELFKNAHCVGYWVMIIWAFALSFVISSCENPPFSFDDCPDECQYGSSLDWNLNYYCNEDCAEKVKRMRAIENCATAWIKERCLKYWEYKLLGAWANTECPSDWVFSINQDGAFSELTIDSDYMFNSDGTFIVNEEGNLIYGKWSLVGKKLNLTYDESSLTTLQRRFIVLSIERGRFEFVDEDGHAEVWSRTPMTSKTGPTIGVHTKGLTPGINFTIVGNSATDNLAIPCDIAKQLSDGMYYVDTKGNIINIEGKIVMKLAELYEGS
tara:strand:+ start:476 stop:1300 length:825 start_codon:yes stop_codon:yes gene_type:complete